MDVITAKTKNGIGIEIYQIAGKTKFRVVRPKNCNMITTNYRDPDFAGTIEECVKYVTTML